MITRYDTVAVCVIFLLLVFLMPTPGQCEEYRVPHLGYSVTIPDDWSIYREEKNDSAARVSFGLPEVWSEVEQWYIENAVSVAAYRRSDLTSVDDVVSLESKRISDILVNSIDASMEFGKARKFVTDINGMQYKTLSVFRFENGIGYVFGFTATAGTYDANLPRFEEFLSTVEFYQPKPDAFDASESISNRARAGYDIPPGKTPKIVTLLEEELAQFPDDVNVARMLATAHYELGNFERVLEIADRTAEATDVISPHLMMLKARSLFELGRFEEAKKVITAYWAFFQEEDYLKKQYEELSGKLEDALSEKQ